MSIEVHVRIRPAVERCVWSSAETVLYSTANPNTRYVYNKVHPNNSTNHTIFKGLEAIVHAAFDGKNVTVMAYGQTGSGKTHSMIGTNEDAGIVPRTAKLLLELKRHTPDTVIRAYYTEIYNESVKDLLEPQRGELALHDAPDGGVFFEKKTVEVDTFEDFLRLQMTAERNRKYGVTNLNDHSSRSHIILTFEIQRSNRPGKSVVNLVDLAGSECAARANTEGQSLREGGFINRSLLTLGNVVDAIVEKRPYVPYRDAKLTRILRTCLGGSGITFILCCINPSRDNFDQTVATLRFTQRAMKIKNDPVVVLNIPPLFTHQYSEGAKQLIEGTQESSDAEYQRGLRDGYMYCSTTTGSVVSTFQSQVADSMHALANAQRLLIAHDHAMAIDHMGRLYNQLNELARQRVSNRELAESERRRQRDIASEIEHRKTKVVRLETEFAEKSAAADTDLAGWEYQLHEAKHRQISEVDLLTRAESARRTRIHYEWAVCMERIASRCVPGIKALVPEGEEAATAATKAMSTSSSVEGAGGASRSTSPTSTGNKIAALGQLRLRLKQACADYADLAMAHEMVRDDIELARRQQRQQQQQQKPPLASGAAATVSPAPNQPVGVATPLGMTPAELTSLDDEEIDRQIDYLEREEKRLMSRAKRDVRRESIRRVRESLRGAAPSRSPQPGRHGHRARHAEEEEEEAHHARDTDIFMESDDRHGGGRTPPPSRTPNAAAVAEKEDAESRRQRVPLASRASPLSRRTPSASAKSGAYRKAADGDDSAVRGSSASRVPRDSYADGVRNALSVLDGLKSRLLESRQQYAAKHGISVGSGSGSRGPYYELKRGSSRTHSNPSSARGGGEDDDIPLSELYARSKSGAPTFVPRDKENVLHTTSSYASISSYATRAQQQQQQRARRKADDRYTMVVEDDEAFIEEPDSPLRRVGIVTRRRMEEEKRRQRGGQGQAVERALYSMHPNSPSVSMERRSQSRQ